MDPNQMSEDLQIFWVWVVAPLALLASLMVAFRLRVPQVTRIVEAFSALRARDPKASGTLQPGASVALSMVASYGAAAAIGAATAVSLGGAGAIAWVWLFAFLLAPLRMAETLLARTSPAGTKAGDVPGSLAGRLLRDRAGLVQGMGWVLLILVPLAGLAFYGGVHGGAITDAAQRLSSPAALPIGLGVAALGAILALVPRDRAGAALGWIGAFAIVVLFVAALVAFFSEAGRGMGAFGRALLDALYDAPRASSFAGATAGEIAFAAMLHLLPPLAASGGVEGAIHAEAKAATKKQAVAALLGPLAYGVLTTFLGFSIVATGAFTHPALDTRSARELTAYRVAFETVSQRKEDSRLFTGLLRIEDGDQGILRTELATERGMAHVVFVDPSGKARPTERPGGTPEKRQLHASWFHGGRPADVMLRYRDGRVIEIQGRGRMGALERRPMSDLEDLVLRAEMLPRGALLLRTSMAEAGGTIAAQIALGAILLLGALGAAAWGIGVASTLRARLPERAARFTAVIPALGLALAALGVVPWFSLLGSFVAGALAVTTSIALLFRAKEAGALSR